MATGDQGSLFETISSLPRGFRYQADVISAAEEDALVREIEKLPFKDFEFHGFVGKRRVVSFGWKYDFNDRELQKAEEIPQFLQPLRRRAAEFAKVDESMLRHALVTEYAPGAAIGWHRDKAVFDEVIGVSLVSACRFRFRRKIGEVWERKAVELEPRSIYLLSAEARSEWEHSIPAVGALRYSITFRTVVETGG